MPDIFLFPGEPASADLKLRDPTTLGDGGSPQTAEPGSAIRNWIIPAIAVVLGAVAVTPAAAARQWTNPAPSVAIGAVTATPLPAARGWTAPAPTVVLGNATATPEPSISAWNVPQTNVSLDLAVAPSPAVRLWVALDAALLVIGPQSATPFPATRSWVALDAVLGELVAEPFYGGIGSRTVYKHPGWHVTVTVSPAIRDWVVPPVRVRLGNVRLLPDPAARRWEVLEPSVLNELTTIPAPAARQFVTLSPTVLVAPDPDEEMLILDLAST